MTCDTTTCPFAFTDESENIQSYSCLPSPYEIRMMRINHDKTWACHSDPIVPCKGAIKFLKEHNEPYKVVDKCLLTEDTDWSKYVENR